MERDFDLIRKILLKLENDFKPGEGLKFCLKVDGYDIQEIGEHCKLIYDKGLVDVFKPIEAGIGSGIKAFQIGPLNDKGHNVLNEIRDEKEWQKIKRQFGNSRDPKRIDKIGAAVGSFTGAFFREFTRE